MRNCKVLLTTSLTAEFRECSVEAISIVLELSADRNVSDYISAKEVA